MYTTLSPVPSSDSPLEVNDTGIPRESSRAFARLDRARATSSSDSKSLGLISLRTSVLGSTRALADDVETRATTVAAATTRARHARRARTSSSSPSFARARERETRDDRRRASSRARDADATAEDDATATRVVIVVVVVARRRRVVVVGGGAGRCVDTP